MPNGGFASRTRFAKSDRHCRRPLRKDLRDRRNGGKTIEIPGSTEHDGIAHPRDSADMSQGLSESAIVRAVAERVAKRLTRKVIATLQQMREKLAGDDSELKTTWDEICAQVQYEESFYW